MKIKLLLIFSPLLFWHIASGQTYNPLTEVDSFTHTPTSEAVPLNPNGGDAVRVVHDLSVAAVNGVGLDWTRSHHSAGPEKGWSFSFVWGLVDNSGFNNGGITVFYPDGNNKQFTGSGSTFTNVIDADYVTTSTTGTGIPTYTLVTAKNERIFFVADICGSICGAPPTVQTITDAKGNVTTLTYTGQGGSPITRTPYKVLDRVTDTSGHYLQLSYVIYNKIPYISSVTTSDGRSVSYSYTQVISGKWFLTGATYSDGTSATYTYTTVVNNALLSNASDVRADGIPNIRYDYASKSVHNIGGFVTNVWNNTDQTLIVSGNSDYDANNPPSYFKPLNATLTYPDGRVYNYQATYIGGIYPTPLVPDHYTQTNAISGTTIYDFNFHNFPKSGPVTIKTTDAAGHVWTEERNKRGKLLSRTAPDGSVATFTYNSAGYLISSTDENGKTTSYTRDPTRQWVTAIMYPDLTTESFNYNPFGQVLTHTRRNGGVETNTYTTDGLLQTAKSAAGSLTTYTYNSNYRVESITDGNGNRTSFEYNDRGEITKVTHADSSFKKVTYDNLGNRLTETNELGFTKTYTYDSLRRVATFKDGLNRVTTNTYDPNTPANAAPILVTFPSGKQIAATYSSVFGYQLSSTTLAPGTSQASTTSWSFDIVGNIVTQAPPAGNAEQFEYDARNRETKHTNAAGAVTNYTYDNVGNLLTETGPNGTTTYTYDSLNRLTKAVYPPAMPAAPPDPVAASYTYDAEGSVKTYTDPNGNGYQYQYDLDERQTILVYPDASSQQFTYDLAGNLKTLTSRDGRVKTFMYDNRNRSTGYTWNDGVTIGSTFTYDTADRPLTYSNANSSITYTYDAADEIVAAAQNVTGLGSKTVQYSYSLDGELATMTYPDGTVLGYTRDAIGDVTDILSGGLNGTPIVHYAYDVAGNRVAKNLANGVNSNLNYDSAQRLTSIADIVSGSTLQSFNLGYDQASRLKYVKRANGKGDVYTYETRNQLTGVQYDATNPDATPINPSRTVSYVFDAAGNRKQTTDSTTGTTNYVANNDNQYTSVGGSPLSYDGRGNTKTFAGVTHTYDAENQLLTSTPGQSPTTVHRHNVGDTTTEIIPMGATQGVIEAYGAGMDGMGDANSGGGGGSYCAKTVPISSVDWGKSIPYHVAQHGLIGENTTVGSLVLSAGTINMLAGSGGQINNGTGGAATGGDINTPGGNGSTTTGGNAGGPNGGIGGPPTVNGTAPGGGGGSCLTPGTQGHGASGQITFTYNVPSVSTTTFAYDAFGHCVKRVDTSGTTYFVYGPDWNIIAEYTGSGVQQARYVHGERTDEILTRTDSSGNTIYYHTDQLGSVTQLTSSTGQLLEQYRYDAYGVPTIQDPAGNTKDSSAWGNRFLFTGREYLSSLNIYDYRNRVYAPTIGRFLQPDSVGHEGDLFSLYRYCGNNPVNLTDPSGLDSFFQDLSVYTRYDFYTGQVIGQVVQLTEIYTDDYNNVSSWTTTWKFAYSYDACPQLIGDRYVNQLNDIIAAPPSYGYTYWDAKGNSDIAKELPYPRPFTNEQALANAVAVEHGNPALQAPDIDPFDIISGNIASKTVFAALPSLPVLTETLKEAINVTSKPRTVEQALTTAEKWLKPGYSELGKPGSGAFRSSDGLRQFRMTLRDITHEGELGPHVHFEKFGPTGEKLKNIHTPLIDP